MLGRGNEWSDVENGREPRSVVDHAGDAGLVEAAERLGWGREDLSGGQDIADCIDENSGGVFIGQVCIVRHEGEASELDAGLKHNASGGGRDRVIRVTEAVFQVDGSKDLSPDVDEARAVIRGAIHRGNGRKHEDLSHPKEIACVFSIAHQKLDKLSWKRHRRDDGEGLRLQVNGTSREEELHRLDSDHSPMALERLSQAVRKGLSVEVMASVALLGSPSVASWRTSAASRWKVAWCSLTHSQ